MVKTAFINVLTAIAGLLMFCSMSNTLMAQVDCDLLDPDFPFKSPAIDCSFAGLGINTQMIKFGHVDEVDRDNGVDLLFMGNARFEVQGTVYFINNGTCSIIQTSQFQVDDEVIFIPSSTDSRVITLSWVYDDLDNCSFVQDR